MQDVLSRQSNTANLYELNGVPIGKKGAVHDEDGCYILKCYIQSERYLPCAVEHQKG
jgi:hypothetical protein